MSSAPSGLPGLGKMGSLAQSAREKEIKSARNIFIFIGLLTIVANVVMYFMIDAQIDVALAAELKKQGLSKDTVDPDVYEQAKNTAGKVAKLLTIGSVLLGVVYLVLAAYVRKKPAAITITGLVLYIAAAAIFGVLDPATLAQGAIIKIIIIVALLKAVTAAIAYEKEMKSAT